MRLFAITYQASLPSSVCEAKKVLSTRLPRSFCAFSVYLPISSIAFASNDVRRLRLLRFVILSTAMSPFVMLYSYSTLREEMTQYRPYTTPQSTRNGSIGSTGVSISPMKRMSAASTEAPRQIRISFGPTFFFTIYSTKMSVIIVLYLPLLRIAIFVIITQPGRKFNLKFC